MLLRQTILEGIGQIANELRVEIRAVLQFRAKRIKRAGFRIRSIDNRIDQLWLKLRLREHANSAQRFDLFVNILDASSTRRLFRAHCDRACSLHAKAILEILICIMEDNERLVFYRLEFAVDIFGQRIELVSIVGSILFILRGMFRIVFAQSLGDITDENLAVLWIKPEVKIKLAMMVVLIGFF